MWRGRAIVFAVGICVGVVGIVTWAQGQVDTAWVRHYSGPGSGSNVADAIEVDPAGHVYVTGRN